ncbi:GGDEF/HDGYP domain-containing response regulator [Sulfurimonas sp.]
MINLKELRSIAKNFKVLYVEDDLAVQKVMAAYLQQLFLDVQSANDGVDGLSAYKSAHFDIVITDLSMPKMNGIEMLKRIRQIHPEQAILITTAHNEPEYMIEAIKIGVDGYIIKPFDYEQLNYELFKISEKLEKFEENEAYKKQLQRMVEQKTSELNALMLSQKDNYERTLLAMVEMIEERDTYTAGHSQRVATYSKMIAKEMSYSDEVCDKIYRAGILHDIGKVATPDVVLLKPGRLSDLEYKLIKEHVDVGYRLLQNIPMFKELAEIVRDHHERCDGSGYPRGITAKEIHPLAKIMMLADTFDAMTTNRIYKGRKDVKAAFAEILSLKGTQFDETVVEAALKALKKVKINQNINQLPHTDIEKERFAYFYKDRLTDLYNQSYLDVVLVQNSYDLKYNALHIFKLKKFSKYNEEYGWKNGDVILKGIADILRICFEPYAVFRIFGDDFVLLDNGECDTAKIEKNIVQILKETTIQVRTVSVSLTEEKIISVDDLEKL